MPGHPQPSPCKQRGWDPPTHHPHWHQNQGPAPYPHPQSTTARHPNPFPSPGTTRTTSPHPITPSTPQPGPRTPPGAGFPRSNGQSRALTGARGSRALIQQLPDAPAAQQEVGALPQHPQQPGAEAQPQGIAVGSWQCRRPHRSPRGARQPCRRAAQERHGRGICSECRVTAGRQLRGHEGPGASAGTCSILCASKAAAVTCTGRGHCPGTLLFGQSRPQPCFVGAPQGLEGAAEPSPQEAWSTG